MKSRAKLLAAIDNGRYVDTKLRDESDSDDRIDEDYMLPDSDDGSNDDSSDIYEEGDISDFIVMPLSDEGGEDGSANDNGDERDGGGSGRSSEKIESEDDEEDEDEDEDGSADEERSGSGSGSSGEKIESDDDEERASSGNGGENDEIVDGDDIGRASSRNGSEDDEFVDGDDDVGEAPSTKSRRGKVDKAVQADWKKFFYAHDGDYLEWAKEHLPKGTINGWTGTNDVIDLLIEHLGKPPPAKL